MEGSEALVVAGKLTLALQDVDLNAGLVISRSGEDLALLGGDGGVAVNDLGADAAQGLNAQAQRGNVEQQQTLDVALQNAALMAAPTATHSSGLMPLNGSQPSSFLTAS